jgi:antibiotic biosynthesis monooxygenase
MSLAKSQDAAGVTTIDPSRDIVTLINVFTTKPGSQQAFVTAQTGEYKRLRGQITGSLAANLHRGLSGVKAANYALFRSLEDLSAWQQSDLMKGHMPIILPYVERAHPAVYRTVEIVSRDSRTARIEVAPGRVTLISVMSSKPEGSGGAEELLASQREAAKKLLDALPGLRAMVLHRGIARSGTWTQGSIGHAPTAPVSPQLALYAQLDGAEAARALMEHPAYRATFTAENPRLQQAEAELYEVAYVQNQEAR